MGNSSKKGGGEEEEEEEEGAKDGEEAEITEKKKEEAVEVEAELPLGVEELFESGDRSLSVIEPLFASDVHHNGPGAFRGSGAFHAMPVGNSALLSVFIFIF